MAIRLQYRRPSFTCDVAIYLAGCYTNTPRSHDVDDQFGTHTVLLRRSQRQQSSVRLGTRFGSTVWEHQLRLGPMDRLACFHAGCTR